MKTNAHAKAILTNLVILARMDDHRLTMIERTHHTV